MDEKETSASCLCFSEEKIDSLYPMYFGISCAFVALGYLSGPDMDDLTWSETRDRMLQGSAHLLGLLVWKIQRGEAKEGSDLLHKLEKAEKEVGELKRRRSEDAKANEKVVSIFASQEQSWLSERRNLRQQIGSLINELRSLEVKKEEVISNLNKKVQENELQIESKGNVLEEEERKRKELEAKLQKSDAVAEELRETLKREAEEHASELWKHKTAFIELVSNQRRLEAEMGRAFRQVEAAKQELESVFKQKEESVSIVQKLSIEVVKMRKDLEQKDKILSAMLRKSKLDSAEKQVLLKEVKISKARRKQAELETQRWRGAVYDFRHDSSRSEDFLGTNVLHPIEAGSSESQRTGLRTSDHRMKPKTLLLEYLEAEHRKERELVATPRMVNATSNISDRYSPEVNDETEPEKYINLLEQRHHLEIDAFAEQMRFKDEKLEAFRWRLLSMELESKRLQAHIEGLDQNLSQLRDENMKLEALLSDREAELKSVKEKFSFQLHPLVFRKTNSNSTPRELALGYGTISSEVKLVRRKSRENGQEPRATLIRLPQEVDTEKEKLPLPFVGQFQESLTVEAPSEEIEVEKEVTVDPGPIREECMDPEEVKVVDKLASVGHCLIEKDTSLWKMDLHALGVSYKIKRLKQQLLMLEKFSGMQRGCEETDYHQHSSIKGFLLLMSLLGKQISRYESLQAKIDDLCKRMHEKDLDVGVGNSSIAKTKEEMKTLEHFLEQTFQLQRYMVATGQKLMEIQSKIAVEFVENAVELNGSNGFDMRRFAEGVRALFKEVQRGLEVRIARIIGDLEGTLACEGIIHLKN